VKDRRAEKMKKHYNITLNGNKFKVLNCIVSKDEKTLSIRTKVFGQRFPWESFVLAEIPADEGSHYLWLNYAGMSSNTKLENWEYHIVQEEKLHIELLNNEKNVRENFKKRHTLSWEAFQVSRSGFIQRMLEENQITFDEEYYKESYLWDLMPTEYIAVPFKDALKMLKAKDEDVWFMSEHHPNKGSHCISLKGKRIQPFLARADANGLANLIEREWYQSYRLSELLMYNSETVLPEDIYVFDESMEWVIAFTHEITCDWSLESADMMKAAEYRLCITNLSH